MLYVDTDLFVEGENGDVPEKLALNPAEGMGIELELRENEKNLSCLHHHGASNILPPNISSKYPLFERVVRLTG